MTQSVAQETVLAAQLAEYALNLKYEDIPAEVIAEAKRRIVDSVGCGFGAIDWTPAKITRQLAQLAAPSGTSRGATVMGTSIVTSLDYATFANGVLFRYLDFNDTYLSKEPAHPSDNLSAVLSVGEAQKSSGKEMLVAAVIAYEIQCRLCDAASIRARGWDHVTYGAFSTALAAGRLFGLNKEQMIHALGLAGTPNVAMRQARVGELSNWKGCAFANAARNGVFAALLAKLGLTGPSHIFEGEMAFWNQVSGEFQLDTLGGINGQSFMIPKTYVKHFPAEYHAQSAIEAALELRPQMGDPAAFLTSVENIHIESFDAAIDIIAGFKEHWKPTSRETADHSMPYMVAAAFMDGDVTLDTFTQERIHDPKLVEFIQKVTVERSAEMNAGYPDGIPNRLTVTMADGRKLQKQVTYPLGHCHNPMKDSDIEAKFNGLVAGKVPEHQQKEILQVCWSFEELSDVRTLFEACNLGLI